MKSIIYASEIGLKASSQKAASKFDNAEIIDQVLFPGCKLILDVPGQLYTSPIYSKFSWSLEGACGGIWGSGVGGSQLWPIDPNQEYIIRFGQEGSNAVCSKVSGVTFRTIPGSKCNAIEIYRGVNVLIENNSFQYFKKGVYIDGTKSNLCTAIRSNSFDRNEIAIYCNALGSLTTSSHISSACFMIQSNNIAGGKVGIFLNRGVRQNMIMGNLIQGQEGASIAIREMSRTTLMGNYLENGRNEKKERIPCLALFGPCRVNIISGELGNYCTDGDPDQKFHYDPFASDVNIGALDLAELAQIPLPSTFPIEYLKVKA